MRESYDALIDSFESIDNLLSRLKIYTMIKPTSAMTAMVIKIGRTIGCAGSSDEYVDSGGKLLVG